AFDGDATRDGRTGLPAAHVCLRGQIPTVAWGAPYGGGGAPLVGIRPGRCAQGSAENSARPMFGSAVASRKRAPAPRSAEPSSALRQTLLPAHATIWRTASARSANTGVPSGSPPAAWVLVPLPVS